MDHLPPASMRPPRNQPPPKQYRRGAPDRHRRAALGQFFTPPTIADFMASMFETTHSNIELLDAGAGAGALTGALIQRLCRETRRPNSIAVTAYEIDSNLIEQLHATMARCKNECDRVNIHFAAVVLNEDFITEMVPALRGDLFGPPPRRFNMAVVNPPYRKIRSDSDIRSALRSIGIETSNLYSAFVALITKLMLQGGQIVAITPRSFCNGPYFKPFRRDFLRSASLRRLHVFESRSAAFLDDDVLQENVIWHVVKGEPPPKQVAISASSGRPNAQVVQHMTDFRCVVAPDDPEQFIRLVIGAKHNATNTAMSSLGASLSDLGLSVSTGRVVDFRNEAFIRNQPEKNTVPLIYPCHFDGGFVAWPKRNSRKPNAILNVDQSCDLLVPAGAYVLVKRFSAKEERRRIRACVYDPSRIDAPMVAFENHLNYFHTHGHGMSIRLAKGLASFLNSTAVDEHFRQFSGHTQVNAADLRQIPYPERKVLERLGKIAGDPGMPQHELDAIVNEEVF